MPYIVRFSAPDLPSAVAEYVSLVHPTLCVGDARRFLDYLGVIALTESEIKSGVIKSVLPKFQREWPGAEDRLTILQQIQTPCVVL